MKQTVLRSLPLVALVGALAFVALAVVHFTSACQLEAITLNGEPVDGWRQRYGMLQQRSVVRQPLDRLAEQVLADDDIYRVDVSWSWPNAIDIQTNAFSPICLLVDKTTGRLYGLEEHGRVVPIETAICDWEQPVVTSVAAGRLFGHCRDHRVDVVVGQLAALRGKNINLFRLIDEIDFGLSDCIQVALAGLPFRLRARPEKLADDLSRFVEFVSRFNPDMSATHYVDLRFDNMIVCGENRR